MNNIYKGFFKMDFGNVSIDITHALMVRVEEKQILQFNNTFTIELAFG